jgi:2-C-methyl-D-erythritol 4-phosphate cytidylyltransferase
LKKYALIVAAGSGTRMGVPTPKQFLILHDRPLLWYSINAFFGAYDDIEIILVLPPDHLATAQAFIGDTRFPARIQLVAGGDTRIRSVSNGLRLVPDNCIVFVHDAVRCLLTKELIYRCYQTALSFGNAVPAIRAVDSIRIETANGNEMIDRNTVRIVQTPQTFNSSVLKAAFAGHYQEDLTDEASVVERSGVSINLIEGEADNIKITRQIDLIIAATILSQRGMV